MTDREAIDAVLQQYFRGFDEGDTDRAAGVFTEDATMTIEIRGQGTVASLGNREEIRAMLATTAASVHEDEQRRHHVTGVQVDTDGPDEKVVTSILLVSSARSGGVGILTTGHQRDVVVRTGEGWRVKARELSVDAPF